MLAMGGPLRPSLLYFQGSKLIDSTRTVRNWLKLKAHASSLAMWPAACHECALPSSFEDGIHSGACDAGFLAIPDFASTQVISSLRSRAEQLVDGFDPSSSASIFSTRNQVGERLGTTWQGNITCDQSLTLISAGGHFRRLFPPVGWEHLVLPRGKGL